jgi:hypothetical protein
MNIRDNAALKAAFDEDVTALGGPTTVATKTRVDQARISRYASISDQNVTTHVPIDVLGDVSRELVRRGAIPKTLQELADQLGFSLVPKAQAKAEDAAPITRHLSDIARGFSELTSQIADALPDGLDNREKAIIDEKAAALETELAELRRDTGARVIQIKGSAA